MRLVHDYSFPKFGSNSTSVNAFIPEEAREVDIASFDSAIQLLLSLHNPRQQCKVVHV